MLVTEAGVKVWIGPDLCRGTNICSTVPWLVSSASSTALQQDQAAMSVGILAYHSAGWVGVKSGRM